MNMAKYVVKRVLFMLLTFFIIISMCFVLIRLLPNETATMFGKDMQLVLQSRYRQGLADINGNPIPLIQQYWNFVVNTIIGGNWGVSEKLYFGQDCFEVFLSKLPSTVLVNLYSSLLAVPIGLMMTDGRCFCVLFVFGVRITFSYTWFSCRFRPDRSGRLQPCVLEYGWPLFG